MKLQNYERFKNIARTTAIIVASTALLSGCVSRPQAEAKDEDDVYVHSNGTYIPYSSYVANGGTINSNTGFATRSANGFTSYTPSSNEISSMSSGSFSGKVSRPAVSNSSSTSTKSFGGSSSRSTSIGG